MAIARARRPGRQPSVETTACFAWLNSDQAGAVGSSPGVASRAILSPGRAIAGFPCRVGHLLHSDCLTAVGLINTP
jgi:hypothetical protein